MRIIIDLDESKRKVRLRTRYYTSAKDRVWLHNAGVATYELIKDAINQCAQGGIVEHDGEAR